VIGLKFNLAVSLGANVQFSV